jgi:hypothetical protein
MGDELADLLGLGALACVRDLREMASPGRS